MPNDEPKDGNPPEEEKGEEEESEEPDPKELRKQAKEILAKLAKIAPEEEESSDEEEEEADKDKEKKEKPAVDPTIIDYANFLKEQLGKNYDKDLDKLPLKSRIGAMKGILKVLGKGQINNNNGLLKEGKIPKSGTPDPPRKRPGVNFKELGAKY